MNINIMNRTKNDNIDLDLVNQLSEQFRISNEICRLMVSRGINSTAEAEKFLNVSKDSLYDPYLLTGMKETVERLQRAVDNNERVVVYGDYDADGICGAFVLTKGLESLGCDVVPYIPNRSEGYGLNIETIDKIIEEYSPDLFLTCDLGISCYKEVEYILDLGCDVIVSDHHELPEILPKCITVNPKLDVGKYPCIDLCGAGVAFKIMQALIPNKFMDYVEFATIATVADSVSLTDENRVIVKLGLEKLNTNPSNNLKIICDGCGIVGKITATTLAFVVAPRINASGRMGDAKRSLEMFLSDDEKVVKDIFDKVNTDNQQRQKSCEEIFKDGYNKFINVSSNRAVILKSDEWQTGLLGIVASKLSEEFSRPTLLFVEKDGSLRGSGRSISGINLYEMLSSMKELFITFGGHAQACGLTILKENFEEFQKRAELYLKEHVPSANFIPVAEYDIGDNGKPTVEYLKELEVLEPYGNGNPKPIFMRREKEMLMSEMKKYPQHLVGEGENAEYLAFSQSKFVDVFRSKIEKALFIDYSINSFKGIEKVKGNIRDFFSIYNEDSLNEEELLSEYLFNLSCDRIQNISNEDYEKIIGKEDFGVLSIANTLSGLQYFTEKLEKNTFLFENNAVVVKSNINRILLNPTTTINFEKYNKIVVFEDFSSIKLDNISENVEIFSLEKDNYLENINVTQNRDLFVQIYSALRSLAGRIITSSKSITTQIKIEGVSPVTIILGYAVFKELGLINVVNKKLAVTTGKKVELTDSILYNRLKL